MSRLAMALFALTASCAAPTHAQTCLSRDVIVAELFERHGEGPAAAGLSARGSLFELFGNIESGSWTLVETSATGMSCVRGHGTALEVQRQEPLTGGRL